MPLGKFRRGTPGGTFAFGADNYRWLMEHIFVGSAARHPDRVVIDVFMVL